MILHWRKVDDGFFSLRDDVSGRVFGYMFHKKEMWRCVVPRIKSTATDFDNKDEAMRFVEGMVLLSFDGVELT